MTWMPALYHQMGAGSIGKKQARVKSFLAPRHSLKSTRHASVSYFEDTPSLRLSRL
jgi:hypothetical protein